MYCGCPSSGQRAQSSSVKLPFKSSRPVVPAISTLSFWRKRRNPRPNSGVLAGADEASWAEGFDDGFPDSVAAVGELPVGAFAEDISSSAAGMRRRYFAPYVAARTSPTTKQTPTPTPLPSTSPPPPPP